MGQRVRDGGEKQRDALVRREEDDRLRVQRVDLGADGLKHARVDIVACESTRGQYIPSESA